MEITQVLDVSFSFTVTDGLQPTVELGYDLLIDDLRRKLRLDCLGVEPVTEKLRKSPDNLVELRIGVSERQPDLLEYMSI